MQADTSRVDLNAFLTLPNFRQMEAADVLSELTEARQQWLKQQQVSTSCATAFQCCLLLFVGSIFNN